ncbi:MAG: metalloregulator ArsR/SmtB family transcription factor [Acidobacteriota bacterium]|nr:metalloregulator ArsR/SmtB family transcription factor [Acidobacteriota bacterium]
MNNKVAEMERFFLALADKTRLRILNLIGEGEICVCFFTEVLQAPQPKISRHLAYLRRSGVVKTRRDGKWIYYSLIQPKDESARRVLSEIQTWMESDEQMQKDHQRLIEICCSPEMMPISIQHLPRLSADAPKTKEPESYEVKQLEDFLL